MESPAYRPALIVDTSGYVGVWENSPGAIVDVNGTLILEKGTSIDEFSVDGTLAGDSNDAVPTEWAVKTYVDGAAGGTLDHSLLANLDYASASHTGFEPTVTKGNLTETTSNVLTITGGTGAVIGSGATIAVGLATPSNGDTTHLSTADQIYDFCVAGYQPLDADLTSIAALGTDANKMAYTTAANTWAEADITAAGRAILDDAAASNQRTTLGLVIGTDVQAHGDVLDDLSYLGANADDGEFLVGDSAGVLVWEAGATARTSIGLGTTNSPIFTAVTVTGDFIGDELTLTNGAQDHKFTTRTGPALVMQGQSSGTITYLNIMTKDGDDSDSLGFQAWGEGTPSSVNPGELMTMGWDTTLDDYVVRTQNVGAGTVYPLTLYTLGNTNQLMLDPNGGVFLATSYDDDIGTERDLLIQADGMVGYDSSSREFKENITDLPNDVSEKIYDLQPRQYDKIAGAKDQFGLIAEEVYEIYPQLVSCKREAITEEYTDEFGQNQTRVKEYRRTNIPETVNYKYLVVPLLQEVQKLKNEIDDLKLRVDELESK